MSQPSPPSVNDRQVGGHHYRDSRKASDKQHWDLVAEYRWDYFEAQIIKYIMRWRRKNGVQDLEKAQHFLEKYISLVHTGKVADPTVEAKLCDPAEATGRGYVNQDR